MTISGRNIAMIRGDTESITVRCYEKSGESRKPVPFCEGDAVYMTVRESADSEALLRKVITNFGDEGEAVIVIDHEDTENMEFGDYVYDIQLTQENGTVTTLVELSRFRLKEEVTYGQ